MSESGGQAVCHCSLDTRVKGPSSEAFLNPAAENPPGCRAVAEDPSAECGGEGSVASWTYGVMSPTPQSA